MRFAIVLTLIAAASFAWSGERICADGVGIGNAAYVPEWEPTKDIVVKWMQLPDCTGTAVTSELCEDIGLISDLADDFECVDGFPIVALEWWGTWYNCSVVVPPPPPIDAFIVKFYEYLPEPPFSRPGELLYEEVIYSWTEDPVPDCDPYDYHYTADLPIAFEQEAGNYYFIQIQCVHVRTGYCQWGWHQCHVDYQWNDQAVLKSDYFGIPDWTPLDQLIAEWFEPAFVLYADETSPVEHSSWSILKALYR